MRRRRLWTAATGFVVVRALALPSARARRSQLAGSERGQQTAIFYYPWYSTPARDGQLGALVRRRTDGQHGALDAVLSDPRPVLVVEREDRRCARCARSPRRASAPSSSRGGASARPRTSGCHSSRSAAARHGLTVAVHVEPYRGRTPASTAEDIVRAAREGDSRTSTSTTPIATLRRTGRTALAPLEGVRVFGHTTLVGRAKASGFDGLYTYDVVTWNGSTFERLCTQAHRAGLAVRAVGRARLRRAARNAGRGRAAASARRDVRPDVEVRQSSADADIVTVTSYNEWQEGTQIEPARVAGRRGRATRERGGSTGSRPSAHTSQATARWVDALRRHARSVERRREPAPVGHRRAGRRGRGRRRPRPRAHAAVSLVREAPSGSSSRMRSSARACSPASSALSTSGSSPRSRAPRAHARSRGGASSSSTNDATAAGPTCTDELGDDAPVTEPLDRRNALDADTSPQRPGFASTSTFASSTAPSRALDLLLEHRRERVARAAPRRPEVDDHRQLVRPLDDVLVERLLGHVRRHLAANVARARRRRRRRRSPR